MYVYTTLYRKQICRQLVKHEYILDKMHII